jgi:uncharacterized protein YndB with AHSA1/START domain
VYTWQNVCDDRSEKRSIVAQYDFVSVWHVNAPIQSVWQAISQPWQWPTWWRGLQRVERLAPGEANGLGSIYRYVWKGALPYRLTLSIRIIRAEPPTLLEGEVTGGLCGLGRWQLSEEGEGTRVCFEWQVDGPQQWMRHVVPLTRRLFHWNHQRLMACGRQGLEQYLQNTKYP